MSVEEIQRENTCFLSATIEVAIQNPEIARTILGVDDTTIDLLINLTNSDIASLSNIYAPLVEYKMSEFSKLNRE